MSTKALAMATAMCDSIGRHHSIISSLFSAHRPFAPGLQHTNIYFRFINVDKSKERTMRDGGGKGLLKPKRVRMSFLLNSKTNKPMRLNSSGSLQPFRSLSSTPLLNALELSQHLQKAPIHQKSIKIFHKAQRQ